MRCDSEEERPRMGAEANGGGLEGAHTKFATGSQVPLRAILSTVCNYRDRPNNGDRPFSALLPRLLPRNWRLPWHGLRFLFTTDLEATENRVSARGFKILTWSNPDRKQRERFFGTVDASIIYMDGELYSQHPVQETQWKTWMRP
jgi:hypothetical protein